mgnify:CR=1 FL=1
MPPAPLSHTLFMSSSITPSYNHSQRERYRNVAFHAYLFIFSWTPISSLAMTFLCPQLHHTPMPKLNTAKGNYHDWIGLVETHLSPPQLRGDPVSPDVRGTLMSYMPFCSLLSPFTARLMQNTWSRPLALNKRRTLFSPWNPSISCTCWLTNVV